jgi:Fur family ferric uptake transcriptional regulator
VAGKYKTKQQTYIKQYLEMQKDGYVTVNQIEKYLKENDLSVGLTTIYRHLEKMENDGVVARLNVEGQSGACFQYIGNNNNDDCFYIKCETCGEVTKMECHHLAELYHHVENDHHFSINSRKTVFYGKCEKCNK